MEEDPFRGRAMRRRLERSGLPIGSTLLHSTPSPLPRDASDSLGRTFTASLKAIQLQVAGTREKHDPFWLRIFWRRPDVNQFSPVEIANWVAIYLAAGLCCAIAMVALCERHASRNLEGASLERRSHVPWCDIVTAEGMVALAEAVPAVDAGNSRHRRFVRRHDELELTARKLATRASPRGIVLWMRYEQFRRFLETTYAGPSGKPLSSGAAGDYASRCRRIEELLGCDLDQEGGDGDALATRIEARAGDLATTGVRSLQTAGRRYVEYRQATATAR